MASEPGLLAFLAPRRNTTAGCTHVSLMAPAGKYAVDMEDIDQFWGIYCSIHMDQFLCYAELTGTTLPVLVDVDMSSEGDTRPLHNAGDAILLATIYQETLRDLIGPSLPEENLFCYYMTKDPYMMRKADGSVVVKHGFHLHFPMIFLPRFVQENELIPRVKLNMKKTDIRLSDHLIDRGYCRGRTTPWLLYGCRKDICMEPYLVDSVITPSGRREMEWRRPLLDYPICTEKDSVRIPITPENIDFHLPRIFSTRPTGRPTSFVFEPRSDLTPVRVLTGTVMKSVNKSDSIREMVDNHTMSNTNDLCRSLVGMLNESRSRDRNQWIYVGWILYNVCNGSDEGLQIFIEFSRRCPEKFDEQSCRYEWNRMVRKNMTMGTLKHLAKEDSPKEYSDLVSQQARGSLDKAIQLNGTHFDIATVLFQKYDHEFTCASIQNRVWYRFCSPIWKKSEDGVELRARISDEIVGDYDRMAREWLSKSVECADGDEAKNHRKKVDQIMKLISRLKQAPFKGNIMRECMDMFYDAGFNSRLDSDPYLIAFSNGVFDVRDHVFRAGRPDDYISLQMPIPYRTDLSMDHPEVMVVRDFIEKIFPDKSLRDYFLDVNSEVFIGGNNRKIVQLWSGDGDNGKSVTQALFEKMLGPYSIKFPTSLIVGKRALSNSACPELVRAGHGVRMAMLQEPDQRDVINIGILKELSGNDSYYARGLYREGEEIQPMFKLVLVCNEPPKLEYSDRATWNRIRVLPFEATFTDDAPEDPNEQLLHKKFPKDKHFADKIPSMAEAFAWFLLDHLRTRPPNREEPHKVLIATSNYQKKNDMMSQFIDDCVAETDQASVVSIEQLYQIFREWIRDNMPNTKVPDRYELCKYLERKWGDPVKNKGSAIWKGFRIMAYMGTSTSTTGQVLIGSGAPEILDD